MQIVQIIVADEVKINRRLDYLYKFIYLYLTLDD